MSTELIIGAVGLATLANTIESCVNGYDKFITSAQYAAVSTETSRLALDIRIEQRKFDMYWKYTGLSKTDCPLLRAQSTTTQKLIVDVVNEICCLLSDSSKLAQDYGFTITRDWDLNNATASSSATNNALFTIYQSLRNYSWSGLAESTIAQGTVSASRRICWVWKDHVKAVGLLDHLRRYNSELYTYLSPKHEFLLRLGEPSFLLPGFNDPDFLHVLVKRSSGGPSDGPLASASELRRFLINFENDEQDRQSLSSVMILARDIWITEQGNSTVKRDSGSFQGEKVIIEYKYINPTLTETHQNEVRKRLKQLIRLLSRRYHPDFRFLRACGIYEDPQDRNRYGLVFKAWEGSTTESLTVHSLSTLLATKSTTFNLGARFKLALALCIAVMQLHAAGWLHKSVTPDNVIFTTVGASHPDISEPRLTGFELTRPDRPMEQSLDVQPDGQPPDLFLHPDRHGSSPARYRKQHDYYALGMCLLCIGGWQPLSRLRRAFISKHSEPERTPGAWTDFVVDYASGWLGPACGEVFRDVVLVCLTGKFPLPAGSDDDTADRDLQTAFFSVVVKKLAECYA